MICPVCKRDLAPTLSICFACGAMMNDTVREELETKISPVSGTHKANTPAVAAPAVSLDARPSPKTVAGMPSMAPAKPTPVLAKPAPVKVQTSPLGPKKTSPTLVGFQTKKAAMPEWRLQLQNSVRQRSAASRREGGVLAEAVGTSCQKQLVTNGANALKADFVEEAKPSEHANPKVAKALKRIEESRRSFATSEPPAPAAMSAAARNYPFNVVSRAADAPAGTQAPKPGPAESQKPRLVTSFRIEKKKFDTNKLPPLPGPAAISSSFDTVESNNNAEIAAPPIEETPKLAKADAPVLEPEVEQVELEAAEGHEEIDDLAPLPHRFNAALFDLIIGVFAGMIAVSPFMLGGGDWLSVSGILAVAAVVAIVTFIYLTLSIGLVGRTAGMRLFSLELIDAEENQYPTLHQAAVHSSLFILSIAFAGLGFLPMFFNEERRAAHDLLAGTILIREF